MFSRVGRGFFRVQVTLVAALIGVFVATQPPDLRGITRIEAVRVTIGDVTLTGATTSRQSAAIQGGNRAVPAADEASVPRTRSVADVRLGPGDRYPVVGLVPRAARVEIVGRDESSEWLAIVFAPGSNLHGWIPRTQVSNLRNVSDLPVASVTELPGR